MLELYAVKVARTVLRRGSDREVAFLSDNKENISVIPIGIPILFGPGVISTLMIFKTNSIDFIEIVLLVCAVTISALIVYITLKNAILLTKVLGITGLKVLTRIMGLVVGAIAAQFIIHGSKVLWLST